MANLFESKRIVRSASIILSANIERVFPLFGAKEEQKWEPAWKPYFLYPLSSNDEKYNVFKAEHSYGENRMKVTCYWVMTEFSEELHKISYATFSGHDITLIDINLSAMSENTTEATIKYILTSLDTQGDNMIEFKSKHIFEQDLKDWENAINNYLTTIL